MRATTLLYIVLLVLMYTPLLIDATGRGWTLYAYWTAIALLAVITAWVETRRWGSWKG